MPIDHYKISIEPKSLCTANYGVLGSVSDRPTNVARPLGRLRPQCPRILFSSDNFRGYNGYKQGEFLDTDVTLLPNGWPSNASTRILDTMVNGSPRKDSSPNSLQRTKRQVFENRHKLAIARTLTHEVKPRSASLYSKRVICLPMFRINLEQYTGGNDDVTVNSARRSLKELMDYSRNRKPDTPRVMSAGIRNYQFVSHGKEFEEVDYNLRRLIISHPVKSTQSSKQNGDHIGARKASGPVSNADTDKMDIRMDSLELNSLDDTAYSEQDTDSVLSPRQGGYLDQTIRQIKHASESSNAYKYKMEPECQDQGTPAENDVVWPSYDDIKRLRQNIRQHKCATRASQMSGPRRVSSSRSVRGSPERTTDQRQPVPTASPNKGRLNPIVVPTAAMCLKCNTNNALTQESTPCPPNSPSLNESHGVTAVNVRFSKARTWQEGECSREPIVSESQFCNVDAITKSSKYSKSGVTVRTVHTKFSQEVLKMPKVTVKILDSKEELQKEASKLHHANTKVVS